MKFLTWLNEKKISYFYFEFFRFFFLIKEKELFMIQNKKKIEVANM